MNNTNNTNTNTYTNTNTNATTTTTTNNDHTNNDINENTVASVLSKPGFSASFPEEGPGPTGRRHSGGYSFS